MPDIFLSYQRDDAATAGALVAALRAAGLDVWWDRDIPASAPWETTIEGVLKSARTVLVCWSPRSVDSENVRSEARWARERGRLIQLFIKPCEPPLFFGERQGIDLSSWTGNASDARIAEIVATVRAALDGQSDSAERPTVGSPVPKHGPGFSGAWAKLRSSRAILVTAALLLVVLAAWGLSDAFGPETRDEIPVVVRPLKPSGGADPSEAALASGITDELIVRLRRIPGLRIGTGTAEGEVPAGAFRGAHVVDGTIRSSGDRLRVTARLLDRGGEVLWSETFDRRLVDLFDVQEAIAASIARALSVSFDVGADSTSYGGTDNPEAYAAYVQFQAHQLDPDQSVPMGYLERALALDPDYVKALAALSTSYAIQANFAPSRKAATEVLAKADEISARAVSANPNLWIGHVARGWYYGNARNFLAAEGSFRRAAGFDDGTDPELRGLLAAYALNFGRAEKARQLQASMERLDPIHRYDTAHVWRLFNQGQLKQVIERFDALAARDPGSVGNAAIYVTWAHLILEGEAAALRFTEQRDPGWVAELRAFKADEPALRTMSLAALRQWAADRYGESGQLQLINKGHFAGYFGYPQLAVDLFRIALERSGSMAIASLWNPVLAQARRTDEFERLVTDIGLAEMWRRSGDWGDYCRPVSAREITCS
jgi:TolB-like protein